MNLPDKLLLGLRNPTITLSYATKRSAESAIALQIAFLLDQPAKKIASVMEEGSTTVKSTHGKFQEVLNADQNRKGSSHGAWPQIPMMLYCLYSWIRIRLPQTVVETGVGHGASSAVILEALKRNGSGRLYSVDIPNARYSTEKRQVDDSLEGLSTGWLVPEHLRGSWDLIFGNSKERLPALMSSLGSIDLFVHDSEHSYDNMMFEFRTAWPSLRRGGCIMSDDVDWNRSFMDFTASVSCRSIEDFGMGYAIKS